MSTCRLPCPTCHRLLELPEDATGRLAKCPACESTFIVGEESDASELAEEGDAAQRRAAEPPTLHPEEPPTLRPEEPQASQPEEPRPANSAYHTPQDDSAGDSAEQTSDSAGQTSDSAGQADNSASAEATVPNDNPFSSPLESGTVSAPERDAHYQRAYHPDPVAAVGELKIVSRSVEEILSTTLGIFGSRWGELLLAVLIVVIAAVAIFSIPAYTVMAIAEAGGELVATTASAIVALLMGFAAAYASVGIAKNAIAIARNSPSPLMELVPPLGIVVRFIAGAIVVMIVAGAATGIFAGMSYVLSSLGVSDVVVSMMIAIAVLIGAVSWMLGYWLLWGWLLVVSDGRSTTIESLRVAYQMTMHNKLTSFLLIVIAAVLTAAGASACYIGLLVTQPFTHLMFATAYLMITNQPVSDPRKNRMPKPPASPGDRMI